MGLTTGVHPMAHLGHFFPMADRRQRSIKVAEYLQWIKIAGQVISRQTKHCGVSVLCRWKMNTALKRIVSPQRFATLACYYARPFLMVEGIARARRMEYQRAATWSLVFCWCQHVHAGHNFNNDCFLRSRGLGSHSRHTTRYQWGRGHHREGPQTMRQVRPQHQLRKQGDCAPITTARLARRCSSVVNSTLCNPSLQPVTSPVTPAPRNLMQPTRWTLTAPACPVPMH